MLQLTHEENIIFLSFFSLLFIYGIFYPVTNLLSKDKSKNLETLTVEKAKSAVKTLTSYLNKAILNSYDINFLTVIDNITKIENIITCFILDKNDKLLIHNNTNEWNTEKIPLSTIMQ